MSASRVEELLGRLLDGDLPDAEMDALMELIDTDESVADDLQDQLRTDGLLTQAFDEVRSEERFIAALDHRVEEVVTEDSAVSPAPNQQATVQLAEGRLRRFGRSTYEVASDYVLLSSVVSGLFLLIVVLSMALIVPDWKRFVPTDEPKTPSVEFVAHITRFENTTWDKASDGNLLNRDLFIDDKLILKEGVAVINYDTGAQLVLEGPATYQIQGVNGGFLHYGKLVARADTAKSEGFTVATPHARIVDLGTEFGLEVGFNGAAEVAVLTGEVEVIRSADDGEPELGIRLTAGQSASIEAESGKIVQRGSVEGTVVAAMRARLELGRQTLIANQTPYELKPGDKYHLVFVTSTRTDREDEPADDIAHWNAYVNSIADNSSLPGVADIEWYAMVSTVSDDARDNAVVSAPVYLLDGETLIATGADDMWDGSIAQLIKVNENGAVEEGDRWVWTGSFKDGTASQYPLGNGDNKSTRADFTDMSIWFSVGGHIARDPTFPNRVYALSEELTYAGAIVPEGTLPEKAEPPTELQPPANGDRLQPDE